MSLLELCMKGCVATASPDEQVPVDFVLESDDGASVLFALPDWWASVDQSSFVVVRGALKKVADDQYHVIRDDGPVMVLEPPQADTVSTLGKMRTWQDIDREAYVTALNDAMNLMGEDFDLRPWIEMVLDRPAQDAVKLRIERVTGLRRVGTLYLSDIDGQVIDCLVVDENGQAATSNGDPWLNGLARNWIEMERRPDIPAFMESQQGRHAYAGKHVSKTVVGQSKGFIEEVANRMFALT